MLTQLKVKNFKSLEDVTIPLDGLTVFVGPNNAGKSNILDCLLFLKELVEQGSPSVDSRGGFRYVVWGGDLKRTIEIALKGQILDEVGMERAFTYEISIVGGPAHFRLDKESFVLYFYNESRKLLEFQSGGTATVRDEKGNVVFQMGGDLTRSFITNLLNETQTPVLTHFAQSIRSWSFYNFVPSRISVPQPARKELRVSSEGDNVSSVLHTLQSEYGQEFTQIESLLKTGLPEVQRLLTALTESSQTYISVEEYGFSLRIPAWAMSDGTLRLLAQLAVLFSPTPPALVCLEEPENFVHPRLLELVADLLKSASKRTQVLVTTHSPYLLNFLLPENLRVIEKVEGKTQCKTVADQAGMKDALKVLGLGELWYSGNIGGVP